MDKLKIRLEEQLRIYKQSPNTTATWIDLARFVEDLLETLEKNKIEGFKPNENR